ncbi:MAG TPA: heme-binding domain-containing protein [Bacteroidota bacterium]|nr:heme-binding domain-containing protein [Bacteroidota bacterium]
MMRKILKWSMIGLVILFGAAQLYQPDRSNPPVDDSKTLYATLSVPPDVRAILDRSCTDCHTNNTHWPWYSYVAPTSWLTAGDVKKGRSSMNFSVWGTYKKTRQAGKLDDITSQLADDKMPLKPYRIMHPTSVLTKEESALVTRWAEKERDRLSAPDTSAGTSKQ